MARPRRTALLLSTAATLASVTGFVSCPAHALLPRMRGTPWARGWHSTTALTPLRGSENDAALDNVRSLEQQAAALREEVAQLEAESKAEREARAAEEAEANPPVKAVEATAPAPAADEGSWMQKLMAGEGDDAAASGSAPRRKLRTEADDIALGMRLLACAPYLLPVCDALQDAQGLLMSWPDIMLPLVLPFAPFALLFNTVPFAGIICFFGLSFLSRKPEYPRFLRFSMQQAILLDIAVISPRLLGDLLYSATTGGQPPPPWVTEPLGSLAFWASFGAFLYCAFSNLKGEIPDEIPVISDATNRQIPF